MRVAPLRGLTACLYLARPPNHGQPKLNTQKRHPLVGAYYLDGDHNRANLHKRGKEKLWHGGKAKRNVYSFSKKSIRRHQKVLKQNRRTITNMSVATEMKVEEGIHVCGDQEFKLEDISSCVSEIFEKKKKYENIPFIQVAPMINVTNRHFRALVRTITRRAQVWTEMIVDNTLLYNLNNLEEHLGFNSNEHPIVCQLGGSDATSLAEAAVLVEQAGYDEINLNVGCPSTKVANKGAFGAYLMKKPEHVRNIVYEIKRKVHIPVSVKIRTGVDDCDSFPFLRSFVECISSVGCSHFIVHARKAWLKGLDPKQNRSVPPLEYPKVYSLCQLYPHLKFTLNGGVKTVEEAVALLNGYLPKKGNVDSEKTYVQVKNYQVNPLHGVMLGRACMENTTVLSQTDQLVYNEKPPHTAFSRRTVLDAYKSYLEENSSLCSLSSAFELLKPVLGILKGMPGHRIFRNKLDMYIRNYASTLPCSGILEKAMVDVDAVAPGCLDLPLADYKLQQEYIKNY